MIVMWIVECVFRRGKVLGMIEMLML
jgi:hypothetical protein